ncbi:hypothetical protein [Saccharopolyspora phatthalungensis]|uniref:Uncharacterized protein n=1 Tax=Saccharopolyspora phatthalungensis TaxID=664693 RepID=A0A840Q374_9PSEU|nr:hypothetical protein [Saccharopolyspora phatthalungensis]MBB5154946.1 hypothetical protein [Saccharopolyspora phatthalungensis]
MLQPPGTGTLAEQFRALERRIEELARPKAMLPVCVIRLNSNVGLAANVDTFAQTGWSASYDPFGMYVPGAAGVSAYIQIERAGYYRVHFHSAIGAANAVAGAKVTLNAANVNNSIATDSGQIPQQGGDGAVLDAIRSRTYLNLGDKLYWSNWCFAAATLYGSSLGVPSEITVQYSSSL